MIEEELFEENNKARFYKTGMGKNFPRDFDLVIAERKSDGFREYILYHNKTPVYSSQSFEAIAVRIDIINKLKE
jgi:hypothetical protein